MIVTLEARPVKTAETAQQSDEANPQPQGGVFLGIGGVPMTAELAGSLNLPEDTQGVLVQEVTPDSPADKANLQLRMSSRLWMARRSPTCRRCGKCSSSTRLAMRSP